MTEKCNIFFHIGHCHKYVTTNKNEAFQTFAKFTLYPTFGAFIIESSAFFDISHFENVKTFRNRFIKKVIAFERIAVIKVNTTIKNTVFPIIRG